MNTIFMSCLVALLVGCGVGYAIGSRVQEGEGAQRDQGTHTMTDGSVMDDGMGMGEMMESMNKALAGKTGEAFDQAFLAEMIVHHEGAVGMAEAALINAKHQEIRDLANAIISAQREEIRQMEDWQRNWYGVIHE